MLKVHIGIPDIFEQIRNNNETGNLIIEEIELKYEEQREREEINRIKRKQHRSDNKDGRTHE